MHATTKRSARGSGFKRPLSDNGNGDGQANKRIRESEISEDSATDGGQPVAELGAVVSAEQPSLTVNAAADAFDTNDTTGVATSSETSATQDDEDAIKSHCGARWPKDVRQRLPAIVQSKDVNASRFNIATPPGATLTQWSKLSRDNAEQYLTLKTKPKDAIRLWAVGEIPTHGTYLVGEHGAPHGSISLKVIPVRDGEYAMWDSFLGRLGGWKPLTSDDDDKILSASRWMMVREKGETTSKARPFQHCYDATTSLRRYKDMAVWPIEKIGSNDLVIMEVRVRRWKCDTSGKSRYTKEWEPYRVGLELSAISMLAVGPDEDNEDHVGNDVEQDFTL